MERVKVFQSPFEQQQLCVSNRPFKVGGGSSSGNVVSSSSSRTSLLLIIIVAVLQSLSVYTGSFRRTTTGRITDNDSQYNLKAFCYNPINPRRPTGLCRIFSRLCLISTVGTKIIRRSTLFIYLHQHPFLFGRRKGKCCFSLSGSKECESGAGHLRLPLSFCCCCLLQLATERGVKFRVLPVRRWLSLWKFVAAHPDNICSLPPTCSCSWKLLTSCLGQLSLSRNVSYFAARRTRSCRSPWHILDLGSLGTRLKFDCWKEAGWEEKKQRGTGADCKFLGRFWCSISECLPLYAFKLLW